MQLPECANDAICETVERLVMLVMEHVPDNRWRWEALARINEAVAHIDSALEENGG